MSDVERIAIVDLADDLQVRKQRIFKILLRLGIRPTQRRDPSRGALRTMPSVWRAERSVRRPNVRHPWRADLHRLRDRRARSARGPVVAPTVLSGPDDMVGAEVAQVA